MMVRSDRSDMCLSDLFAGLGAAAPPVAVNDISSHSTRVTAGGLFLACKGYQHHGLEFLANALAARPAAVAWEPAAGVAAPDLPADVVGVQVNDLADQLGNIADRFFAQPSAQLQVTGVTGTNGKTTTAWLASHALSILGRTAAYMGTLGYGIGDKLATTALTTPACITAHRRLRELADDGAELAVMEVSSHGLDQGRLDGVRLRAAAFTNLSRDHLDYHGDVASYATAKARMFHFDSLESAVINIGDAFGVQLTAELNAAVNVITVAMAGTTGAAEARLVGEIMATGPAGLLLKLHGEYGDAELHSPMWGAFNAENLLVAAGIVIAHGFSLEAAAAALGQCIAPPGRMQVLRVENCPMVIVDFAHTPDALSKALQALRGHCHGQVWLVFGCGGDRDRGKREQMGAVAEQLADRVVITSDNPRSEDPASIATAIVAGMVTDDGVHIELQRRQAIRYALDKAAGNDVVLIAGKGSEEYQITGDRTERFSDIAVANQYLRMPQ